MPWQGFLLLTLRVSRFDNRERLRMHDSVKSAVVAALSEDKVREILESAAYPLAPGEPVVPLALGQNLAPAGEGTAE